MVDTYNYMFVQTHRMYNTKSAPQCIVWTLHDCINVGSSIVTKVPVWWGGGHYGENYTMCWGWRYMENLCTFLLIVL